MKLVTVDEMRQLETHSEEAGVSTDTLMEKAGLAVAHEAAALLGDVRGRRVLVLVGPGNNGGDGLVVARHLQAWGASVTAYLCVAGKALASKLEAARQEGVEVVDAQDDLGPLRRLLRTADLAIDAILGTGRARPIEGELKEQLAALAEARRRRPDLPLLALDIPTGLDSDSGQLDPAAVAADVTVTLGYRKVGLYTLPGAEAAGRVVVRDIGIPPHLGRDLPTEILEPSWVGQALPRRPSGAHKGTFGRLLVVAGSHRYVGAAYLACAAAGRIGAGLVTLATVPRVQAAVAALLPEVTYLPQPEHDWTITPQAAGPVMQATADCEALLIGCGLGETDATVSLIQQVLLSGTLSPKPVIIDADGLNALSHLSRWWERLETPAILTPHPGEMGRLTGEGAAAVQGDRLGCARRYAREWGKVVVLKGAYTVVAAPDGRARVNPFANPALASAGTGDVLAGAIAGLLAQGLDPYDAASCGVFLHAAAADRVSADLGDAGLLASDLLPWLPRVMREVKARTGG